ncbi:MAG: hypothetical protein JSW26_06935 [Desulfobacterales bacterium]|nr:MAG: hypothetical protein JSW26_06935 [Desulfobacterales bacterium]
MAENKSKEQMVVCPVGKFFMELEDVMGKKSKFFEHMTRSRIEFLKGIRSLLDERISYYEKKGSKKTGKKMTKIKVD